MKEIEDAITAEEDEAPPGATLKPVTEDLVEDMSDLDLGEERSPVVFAGGKKCSSKRCARVVVRCSYLHY